MWPLGPLSYPDARYYYDWIDAELGQEVPLGDAEIKSTVVRRLKENPHAKDDDTRVDVKQRVVVLGGEVSSWLSKRAAGDDVWDTPRVVDVSNQLAAQQTAGRSPRPAAARSGGCARARDGRVPLARGDAAGGLR